MKCTVCKHKQRHDIDQALLAENATFADLSQKYGSSISARWRHRKHLLEKMRQAEARLQHRLQQDYLLQYNEYLETTRQIVRTASADGNTRQALQAIREGTRILNFITKLDVHLDSDTVYRHLASPQWVSQDSLLPTDPQFRAPGHQSLAHDFFFPCPELPPDPKVDAWDEEDAAASDLAQTAFFKNRNSAFKTPNTSFSGNRHSEIEVCCFPLEIDPKYQREIRIPDFGRVLLVHECLIEHLGQGFHWP